MSEPGITGREWHELYVRLEGPLYNLAYRYVWHRKMRRTPYTKRFCSYGRAAFPWPHRERLQLPLSGARLIGERSHGTTVRLLDDPPVVALPSGDPNVELYWIGSGRSERALNGSRKPPVARLTREIGAGPG